MAKCPKCGKKGLFLKLTTYNLCDECTQIRIREDALAEIEKRTAEVEEAAARADELLAFAKETAQTQAQMELIQEEAALRVRISELEKKIAEQETERNQRSEQIQSLTKQSESLEKKVKTAENRITKAQRVYDSIQYAVHTFTASESADTLTSVLDFNADIEDYRPDLKCLTVKELRSLFKKNAKDILELTQSYKSNYTTKANAAIYQLMTMALDAELTNILHTLSFGKLEDGIDRIKELTGKYYYIAREGNQTIAPTLRKFIGQLEYFYIEAVKIEYEYYTQQARIKEEQRMLREQMRQEAEERKLLEQQRKQVENEEKKYQQEINRVKAQMDTASAEDPEVEKLRKRLEELEQKMAAVETKKEDIINLQNGKAGTVYIISNIGSFGENVYKVGMTRRLEPQERIDELGNASVPFPFDVHSFIFSEDAVSLETQLHKELNNRRVNKVNLRKEFFSITLDELREMVERIDPTAPFTETALAEQYRQSLSMGNEVAGEIPVESDSEDIA